MKRKTHAQVTSEAQNTLLVTQELYAEFGHLLPKRLQNITLPALAKRSVFAKFKNIFKREK